MQKVARPIPSMGSGPGACGVSSANLTFPSPDAPDRERCGRAQNESSLRIMPHTRRRFLISLAGATTGLLAGWPAGGRGLFARDAGQPSEVRLRIGLVLPGDGASSARVRSFRHGAQLGAEEASHAARLFGGTVDLSIGDDAGRLVGGEGAQVLIGGTDEEGCSRLIATARSASVLCFNVGCAGDALRGANCDRHTFHVAASASMQRDAAALADAPATPGDVAMWHESLERFGAGQLNARFRDRFGSGMDSDAWAAWFAVKVAAETALRARTTSPAELIAALVRPTARFDGHKGHPLTFRSWDHQLRQPLYLVGRGADPSHLIEVPGRAGEGVTVAEQLDQLGMSASDSACRWERA